MNLLRHWLNPPVFENANITRTAALLNQILLVSAGMWLIITTTLVLTQQFATSKNVWISYLLAVLLLGLRELLRRGFVRASAILLPLVFWAGATLIQYQLGNFYTSHVIGYVLASALAALLVGPTAGFLMVLASAITIFLMNSIGSLGWLPPQAALPIANQPIIFIADMTILFLIVAITRENLFNALYKAEQEVAQRRKAEEELRRNNANLDEIVNQRTRELQTEVKYHRETEIALHESDAKFRVMMEFTQDWDFWVGVRQEIRYMTSSCKNITGYASSEFTANPALMERIVHPDDLARYQEHTLTALRKQIPCEGLDFRILRADGEERWIGHVCHPVFSAQGIYLGNCSSNRDITEQKHDELRKRQMEEALRQSEERFRAIFENAPFAYQALDAAGCLLFVNPNFCAMLGFQREEMLGRHFSDFWSPELRPSFQEKFAVLQEQGHIHIDLQLVRKDGQPMFTILAGRIQNDLDGQFLRTHCILTDVTEKQVLQARIERQNELLVSLNHNVLEFLQYRDIKQLFKSLLDQATQLLDAPVGEIVTLEEDVLAVCCFTANQPFLAGKRSQRDQTVPAWQVVDSLTPVILEDYAAWPYHRSQPDAVEVHAMIIIPMVSGDGKQCLGVMSLGRQERGRPFNPDEIETARVFAQLAGLAVENVQLQATLTEQAIRDPLTGLYNRYYLFEALQREVSRAMREKASISLILFGIDHFTAINDTYGHNGGDAVLRAIAEQFKRMVRSSDILCRYGGDEHMVAMYNMPPSTALARAEQWRQIIANLPIHYNGQILNITISLGVASFPEHGSNIDQVIASADQALYQSKIKGRNRVTLAESA